MPDRIGTINIQVKSYMVDSDTIFLVSTAGVNPLTPTIYQFDSWADFTCWHIGAQIDNAVRFIVDNIILQIPGHEFQVYGVLGVGVLTALWLHVRKEYRMKKEF